MRQTHRHRREDFARANRPEPALYFVPKTALCFRFFGHRTNPLVFTTSGGQLFRAGPEVVNLWLGVGMNRKRILIADDEEGIRMIIRIALGEELYDLSEAGDGEEAWQKIITASPAFD